MHKLLSNPCLSMVILCNKQIVITILSTRTGLSCRSSFKYLYFAISLSNGHSTVCLALLCIFLSNINIRYRIKSNKIFLWRVDLQERREGTLCQSQEVLLVQRKGNFRFVYVETNKIQEKMAVLFSQMPCTYDLHVRNSTANSTVLHGC